VSTDDKTISETAIYYGAKVPFLRNEKTSNDFATLADVIEEVILTYNNLGRNFDFICCLLPTAPFITHQRIIEAYNILTEKKLDAVFPVVQFSYPIQRALKIEDDKVSMIWPENMTARSQDLMPAYHDSGQFYWINTQRFLETKKIFAPNSGAIVLSDLEVQDIDTEDDWKMAEIKFQILKTKKN